MNKQEAATVCRVVRTLCPAQKFDEQTPDMWGIVLVDTRFEDAKLAVANLGKVQAFIAPAEIIAEVKRIREKRLADHPEPTPPDGLSPCEYQRWLKDVRRQIADGNPPEPPAQLSRERDMRSLRTAFQTIPDAG